MVYKGKEASSDDKSLGISLWQTTHLQVVSVRGPDYTRHTADDKTLRDQIYEHPRVYGIIIYVYIYIYTCLSMHPSASLCICSLTVMQDVHRQPHPHLSNCCVVFAWRFRGGQPGRGKQKPTDLEFMKASGSSYLLVKASGPQSHSM